MNGKPRKTADLLRSRICDGEYALGERLPPERSLASAMGCAQFTIGKAIAILAAEGLVEKRRGSGNYVRSTRSHRTVAFLTNERGDCVNPVWRDVFDTMSVLGADADIHYLLCVIPQDCDAIPVLKLQQADVVVVALGLREALVGNILRLEKPIIWLEEYSRELPGEIVSFDNFKAGEIAADHLYELGCRKLLYVQYDGYMHPAVRRFEGFRNRLQSKDGYFNLMTFTWFGEDSEAMRRMSEMLELQNGFDAVFCFSDYLVPWVVRAAHLAGRSIPGDLAVMGVDGSQISSLFIPSITTIDHSATIIGERAHGVLSKMLEGDMCGMKTLVLPRLIPRDSTIEQKNISRKSLENNISSDFEQSLNSEISVKN